jgi:preprotein translocase subunit SecG
MNILFGILLTVQIIICVSMIGLILLQRSEGGALGMGGGPSGLVSARGAGNLLTRTTGILGVLFFVNCIALSFVGQQASGKKSVIDQVGLQNVTLDPNKLALPPAQTQAASASSASSAQPSLTELPRPAAQVAPPPQIAIKPAASGAAVPSPTDSLNSLKALDKKKDAIMGSSSAAPSSSATPSSSGTTSSASKASNP